MSSRYKLGGLPVGNVIDEPKEVEYADRYYTAIHRVYTNQIFFFANREKSLLHILSAHSPLSGLTPIILWNHLEILIEYSYFSRSYPGPMYQIISSGTVVAHETPPI